MVFLKIVLGILGCALGMFFSVFTILGSIILVYGLYRKMIQKLVKHKDLGDIVKTGSEGVAKVNLSNSEIEVSFPMRGDGVDDNVLAAITRFKNGYEDKLPEIGLHAVTEWDQISDVYNSPEDEQIYAEVMASRENPLNFVMKFVIQKVSIDDDPEEIEVEYLTPWDPEHTRCVKMDYRLNIVAYGMTCAL
jgi:hypothetical protein